MYSYVFNRFYQNKLTSDVDKVNIPDLCVFHYLFKNKLPFSVNKNKYL